MSETSPSMSLGNLMPPAAATRATTPDKVNETDYKLSLIHGQSSASELTLPNFGIWSYKEMKELSNKTSGKTAFGTKFIFIFPKSLKLCSDFYPRRPFLRYLRGFIEK